MFLAMLSFKFIMKQSYAEAKTLSSIQDWSSRNENGQNTYVEEGTKTGSEGKRLGNNIYKTKSVADNIYKSTSMAEWLPCGRGGLGLLQLNL